MARVRVNEKVFTRQGHRVTVPASTSVLITERASGDAATVYAGASGDTEAANPVAVTDGEFEVWLEEGSYNALVSGDGSAEPFEVVFGDHARVRPLNASDFGIVGDGSDETAALTAFAEEVASRGRSGQLPDGATIGVSGVSLASNLRLHGWGDRTVIKVLPASGPYSIYGNAVENVELRDFEIDGDKANIAGDPDVAGNPSIALYIEESGDVRLKDLHVHDAKRLGIALSDVSSFMIRDCLVEDNDRDGITIYRSSEDGSVKGCHVYRCNDDYIALNAEVAGSTGHTLRNVTISGNVLKGPGARDRGKGIFLRGAKDCGVIANEIDSPSDTGIYLADIETTALVGCKVAKNIIRNAGADAAGSAGIILSAGEATYHSGGYASVHDIDIVGNLIDAPVFNGIILKSAHLAGECYGIAVEGNRVFDAAGGDGIALGTGLITDVDLIGNRVRGARDNGIVSTTSTNKRLAVRHNRVWNGSATAASNEAGIRVENAEDIWVTDNHAYDDRGGSAVQGIGLRLLANTGVSSVIRDNSAFGNTSLNYSITKTVAAAASITLPAGRLRRVEVTGTADIGTIAATAPDHVVTLVFSGTAATTGVTGAGNIDLSSALGTFAYTPGDSITLACDGVSWTEVARSVN